MAKTEGLSVLVVTPTEEVARAVASSLARRMFCDRIIGNVLHAEWTGKGWEVVVRDLGSNHTRPWGRAW